MTSSSNLPDLIISLSRDKVTFDLSERPEKGRERWKTSFAMDSIFLEDQISQSIDKALLENSSLLDDLPCVEIVLIDRPNFTLPRAFYDTRKTIAPRYLRLRAGDFLTSDVIGDELIFCYTVPSDTLRMLREYYSNSSITHLSSLLWRALSEEKEKLSESSVTFYIVVHDTLIVLGADKGKLVFSKNFNITGEADLFYFSIACSRMLKSKDHWLVSIEHEQTAMDMPGDAILKIDHHITLPSLHLMMAQYKPCAS